MTETQKSLKRSQVDRQFAMMSPKIKQVLEQVISDLQESKSAQIAHLTQFVLESAKTDFKATQTDFMISPKLIEREFAEQKLKTSSIFISAHERKGMYMVEFSGSNEVAIKELKEILRLSFGDGIRFSRLE